MYGEWQPIETAPGDGNCIVAVQTDEGYVLAVLERDNQGQWIHEGEPTYCHSYYFEPKYWMALPELPRE